MSLIPVPYTRLHRSPLLSLLAQTLHAFLSSNPTSHLLLLQSPLLPSLTSILSTPTPPTQKTARTDSHAASDPTSDAEDWLQLRVLAFGILLELTKAGGKGLGRDEMRETLKENQGLLLSLVATDLNAVAAASVQTHSEMVGFDISPFPLFELITTLHSNRTPSSSKHPRPPRPPKPSSSPPSNDNSRPCNSLSKSSANGALPWTPKAWAQ